MAGKGGARPGAGRKPKAFRRLINETPIQAAETMIRDRLPWLAERMFELAEGVHRDKAVNGTTVIVYQEIPDRQAIAYLMDRIMGKPVQPIDLVDRIRKLAAAAGLTDDEATEAVAEAERMLRAGSVNPLG